MGEQVDAWTKADNVRLGMVWLRKKGDKVLALNAECPHLGCKVGYDAEKKHFACPCHESAFSLDGERLGGPAPRAMDPLESRLVGGQVEVRFVRFRAQVWPGDTLTTTLEVTSVNPEGAVELSVTTTNQSGEVVLEGNATASARPS